MSTRQELGIIVVFIGLLFVPLFGQLDNGPWPMFQHDPQHTGRATSNGPENPTIVWSINITHGYGSFTHVYPPVVSSDSVIYFGADWSEYMVYDTGAVYAVNPNGTIKWIYKHDNMYPNHYLYRMTIAIDANGHLRIASQSGTENVFSLTVHSDSASFDWRYFLPAWPEAPTIGPDGSIYITAVHGYALYPDGAVKWIFNPPGYNFGGPSPCLSHTGDTVYYLLDTYNPISGYTDPYLYCVNAMTGEQLWGVNFFEGLWVGGAPVIDDVGNIYCALAGGDSSLLCMVTPSGSSQFLRSIMGTRNISIALSPNDNTIYVLTVLRDINTESDTISLYSFNKNPFSLNWVIRMGDNNGCCEWAATSNPFVDSSGTIYFIAEFYHENDTLYAINPDGTRKWALEIGYGTDGDGWDWGLAKGAYLYAGHSGDYGVAELIAIGESGGSAVFEEPLPYSNKGKDVVCSFFRNRIILKFNGALEAPLTIRLYDISGRLIIDKSYAHSTSLLTIDDQELPKLSTGVYFLSVFSGNRNLRPVKLIKFPSSH